MKGFAQFQIGKAGATPAVIAQLNKMFEYNKHIRISMLPSSGRNRNSIKESADDLVKKLVFPCEYSIIGFTIALRRRTPQKK